MRRLDSEGDVNPLSLEVCCFGTANRLGTSLSRFMAVAWPFFTVPRYSWEKRTCRAAGYRMAPCSDAKATSNQTCRMERAHQRSATSSDCLCSRLSTARGDRWAAWDGPQPGL